MYIKRQILNKALKGRQGFKNINSQKTIQHLTSEKM